MVLFCHGSSGSKLDGLEYVELLLGSRLNICIFDFSGCGLSEGDIITYGVQEKDDIACVMDHLNQLNLFDKYCLWGRSMGAASIL